MLEEQDLAHLRRPFTVAAVRFRPMVAKPDKKGRVKCLAYIDARLASERLNEVDPGYSFGYEFLSGRDTDLGRDLHFPVRGILTVKGATREDVGQLGDKNVDDKYAKSAVSDALKRAAVLFGVGSYLYALGDLFVDRDGYWTVGDRVKGLTSTGMQQLRKQYQQRIESEEFEKRFGKPVDYGDIVLPVDSDDAPVHNDDAAVRAVVPSPASTTPSKPSKEDADKAHSDEEIVGIIGELAVLSGGTKGAATKWARGREDKQEALGEAVERALANGLTMQQIEETINPSGFDKLKAALNGLEVTA